jgi:hypothetical protein
VCGTSTISYDPSYACAGASGRGYYCTVYLASVTSSSTSNGYCFDSAAHAYAATSCTSTSQILSDTYQSGACSGASYDAYVWYCPGSSSGGSGNNNDDGGMFSGLSDGQRTCASAVFVQAFAEAFSTMFSTQPDSDLALSDATCKVCGNARFCPVGRSTYTDLNPALFSCVSGGRADNGVVWCAVKPTGGFVALVVILPLLGLAGAIAGCCFCCPACPGYKSTHRSTAQPVMQPVMQPPVMVAMNPLMVAPSSAPPLLVHQAVMQAPAHSGEEKNERYTLQPQDAAV